MCGQENPAQMRDMRGGGSKNRIGLLSVCDVNLNQRLLEGLDKPSLSASWHLRRACTHSFSASSTVTYPPVPDLRSGVAGHSDGYSGRNVVGGLAHPVEYPAKSWVLLGLCAERG